MRSRAIMGRNRKIMRRGGKIIRNIHIMRRRCNCERMK
jgi:hypothetical protein